MIPDWQQFLSAQGANLRDDRVADFGDAAAELHAARHGTVLCDLSHFGVIEFSGDDAQAFLHSQLTSDVKKVQTGTSQYSGYCTPKGRLLASLLLWRGTQSCFAQLPQALLPAILKRLSMYILRSKVKAADASAASVRMGLAGAQAQALLAATFGTAPDQPHAVLHHTQASVLALPGGRYEIVAAPEHAAALWSAWSKTAHPAGAACWDWLEIRAGIATIVPATQEHFVPQMANLDATGAVAFNKGCYPGQEIVARTQYLGKVKRRLYLAHLDVKADAAPQAGDELYSADMEGQANGMVASAAPAPGGGYDVLAVIQVSSAEAQPVHWRALDGPALQLLTLPYTLSH